ncbi:MAG: restriction endonuclease subunit S [Methylococcales bacterium]
MELKAGYKQTEVGVIPDDWEVKKLGDVLKVKHGKSQKEIENINGQYPILGTGGLMGYTNHFLYDKESVLIGRKGTIDKPRFMNSPFWTVDTLFYTEIFNKYLPKYLYYKFLQVDWYSYNEASGVPSLNAKTIENIEIAIPPTKAEQAAIATALSDVDALISALNSEIAKKRLTKQGAMQELLSGKKRLAGFSGEWEVKELNEVCDVRDGTHESPKYFENGIAFITSKNIIKGKIDFSDVSYISKKDSENINKRSKVDKGDILMSMIGTIGNSVLIDFEPDFCIKNVALIKPKKIENCFLIQLLNSQFFQTYLQENLDGGIQKFISLSKLRGLEIEFPIKKEQTAITQILSDMDSDIQTLETERNKTLVIKQGMMQELLTGKTRLISIQPTGITS